MLTRARLNGRHTEEAALEWAINIYEAERNPAGNTINWRFYTQDAKTKLDRLDPFNMRANSSALIFRLIWQSSLATLPSGGRSGAGPALTGAFCTGPGHKKWRTLNRTLPSLD